LTTYRGITLSWIKQAGLDGAGHGWTGLVMAGFVTDAFFGHSGRLIRHSTHILSPLVTRQFRHITDENRQYQMIANIKWFLKSHNVIYQGK